MQHGKRGPAFWLLGAFFCLFVLFLYGPTLTILVLSFQGPSGGLTFPMNGVSRALVQEPVREADGRRLRRARCSARWSWAPPSCW